MERSHVFHLWSFLCEVQRPGCVRGPSQSGLVGSEVWGKNVIPTVDGSEMRGITTWDGWIKPVIHNFINYHNIGWLAGIRPSTVPILFSQWLTFKLLVGLHI